jgi:hypothetical protein
MDDAIPKLHHGFTKMNQAGLKMVDALSKIELPDPESKFESCHLIYGSLHSIYCSLPLTY